MRRRILYTSHMGARPDSPFAAAPDHAATEALLRDSGVPYTSLRNGFYADTPKRLIAQALQAGSLTAPAGRTGQLDRARRSRRGRGGDPDP